MEDNTDAQTRAEACLQPPSWKQNPSLQPHISLFPAWELPPGTQDSLTSQFQKQHSGGFAELTCPWRLFETQLEIQFPKCNSIQCFSWNI